MKSFKLFSLLDDFLNIFKFVVFVEKELSSILLFLFSLSIKSLLLFLNNIPKFSFGRKKLFGFNE